MKTLNRTHHTALTALAVAFLGTGIASAQTRAPFELSGATKALRTATATNAVSRSNAFQSLSIDRATVRPLDVKRIDALSGYSQPRAGDVAVCPLVVAGVAAAAAVVVAGTEVAHRVHESWMPSGLDSVSRGGFTNLGLYDR